MTPDVFIKRWKSSGSSERGNFQQFLIELASLIEVPPPNPVAADGSADDYRFERPVKAFATGNTEFIDLYRKGSFVMEAKQGANTAPDQPLLFSDTPRIGHGVRGTRRWDDTMVRARAQADRYARAVARQDGWPPFLLVVDVGHMIEVYADFSGQGQGYAQFPDKTRYRIALDDLQNAEIRTTLRMIWTDPQSLDPAKISARVTREIAGHLAELGKSFEGQGHAAEVVARFLMRCLFTMFAEDVRLIPENSFKDLLKRLRGQPELAQTVLSNLFQAMDRGEPSDSLMSKLKRFNGGLFADATALPLDRVQLSLLIAAAECDWKTVEPAIFGTLLERALDSRQRHKLGAHYTPRAYVERLINPVLMEPLRADWDAARASAILLARQGQMEQAREALRSFHHHLCEVRVLDPACGSGNFLYVALELMKRLEGEVTAFLTELGDDQSALHLAGHTVDPHQFLGVEVNPWAAAVAELVLWIGYLQWHFRTHGHASPAEPVLRDFKNIENRDAVLDWDDLRERRDKAGNQVTRWDGIGTVEHPATGERVPDPQARVQVWDYLRPRPAKWPQADFIVGNPPFIGKGEPMRSLLGDGYTEALRAAYPKVPESADFVMYWWEKAARATRQGEVRRFGLITTNSLRQTFNRRVLEPHLADPKTPLSLLFAIPDHPWVDAGDGAAVRIAMTVAVLGTLPGRLVNVIRESKGETEAEGRPVTLSSEKGRIFANLRIGADVAGAFVLKANGKVSSNGMMLAGQGFVVPKSAMNSLGLGIRQGLEQFSGPFLKGGELNNLARNQWVLDFYGLSEVDVRRRFPEAYQHLVERVLPERAVNADKSFKEKWWVFGRPRTELRPALAGLARFIVTTETSKHRMFVFTPSGTRPDHMLIAIACDDAALLAVLSSRVHVTWALAAGGRLGYGNDPRYNKSRCFDPFPFPNLTNTQKSHLRNLGEQLDAHRKAQQAAHPKLTLTAMYNVLEKLRAGVRIEGKDREVYEQGLIGVLKKLHDDIDTEVAAAYGWPVDIHEADMLQRLVDLNHERAIEEAQGLVRWLRPEYQNPAGRIGQAPGEQVEAELGISPTPTKTPWPKSLPLQIAAVQATLEEMGEATPQEIARRFARGRAASIQPLLESLTIIGRAQAIGDGRFLLA